MSNILTESIKQASLINSIRSLLMLMPMVIAAATNKSEWIIPFGQGGVFLVMMPLAKTILGRLIVMFVTLTPGLGYYLIGGNSTTSIALMIIYALVVGISIGLLTGWRYIGMAAASVYVPLYTAGLNAGSPEKAAASFVGFSIIILYGNLINLLPYWNTPLTPPAKEIKEADRIIFGVKLGLGISISLAVAEILKFTKLGWAPSAAGSVIRPGDDSKSKAAIRTAGVLLGAIIASLALAFLHSINSAVIVVLVLGVINGALAYTPIGSIPIFYNAVILILYTYTGNPSGGLVADRVIYNVLGVLVALVIVYYPLPRLTKLIYEAVNRVDSKGKK